MTEISKTAAHWNKMVGVRLDAKTRYLAELAADAKGFATLTDYFKWALEESFKRVTLRLTTDRPEPIYGTDGSISLSEPPDPEEERVADEAMSVANLADKLWSESEFCRIESLSILVPHRLGSHDALLQYIHNRKDLRISAQGGYKLNREKIDEQWESIKADFAKTKGKVK